MVEGAGESLFERCEQRRFATISQKHFTLQRLGGEGVKINDS